MFKMSVNLSREQFQPYFNFYMLNSKYGKIRLRNLKYGGVILIVYTILITLLAKPQLSGLIIATVLQVFFLICWLVDARSLYLSLFRPNAQTALETQYKNEDTALKYDLIFEDTYMMEINPYSENIIYYSAIKQVFVTYSAVYIIFAYQSFTIAILDNFEDKAQKQPFIDFITSKVTDKTKITVKV